jgi:hypothetical protein
MKGNFGLVVTKQEGKAISMEYPEIPPWDGCKKEFEKYFNSKYSGWPFFIRYLFKKTAEKAWDYALLANAYKNKM